MNNLIYIMANDMNIRPYKNELEAAFEFRVIYSALGLWCLQSAFDEEETRRGISKNSQSILLHKLTKEYVDICPETRTYIFPSRNADIAVFIRKIYEQTGYLLTLENNYNILNNSNETVKIADGAYLCLELPDKPYKVNGLGIHVENSRKEIELKDFLVRDDLTPEEYLKVNFDECDFNTRDLDGIEFFNPYHYGNVSNSWNSCMKTNITMARKSKMGPYYKVIRKEKKELLFAEDQNVEGDFSDLTGAEFRRIYVALRKYYDNPMQILICPIDEQYSYIRILGQLPNREYYYLLMNAWPKNGFLDRNNFIIRNKLMEQMAEVLKAIGFTARNGEFYG